MRYYEEIRNHSNITDPKVWAEMDEKFNFAKYANAKDLEHLRWIRDELYKFDDKLRSE